MDLVREHGHHAARAASFSLRLVCWIWKRARDSSHGRDSYQVYGPTRGRRAPPHYTRHQPSSLHSLSAL
eukprot:5559879-Prymnesium_polylepis.1